MEFCLPGLRKGLRNVRFPQRPVEEWSPALALPPALLVLCLPPWLQPPRALEVLDSCSWSDTFLSQGGKWLLQVLRPHRQSACLNAWDLILTSLRRSILYLFTQWVYLFYSLLPRECVNWRSCILGLEGMRVTNKFPLVANSPAFLTCSLAEYYPSHLNT